MPSGLSCANASCPRKLSGAPCFGIISDPGLVVEVPTDLESGRSAPHVRVVVKSAQKIVDCGVGKQNNGNFGASLVNTEMPMSIAAATCEQAALPIGGQDWVEIGTPDRGFAEQHSMAGISVILCTHNPRPDYLRRVLEALDAQTLPKEEWELLLIDNASETPLAERWGMSWHPRARHIREENLGLTSARLRGVRESCENLVIYVDDDNVLDASYLQRARALLMEHPYLSVIGAGRLEPEFEVPPSPELVPYLGYLSLRSAPRDLWSINTDDLSCVPWGAGLCVRRQVTDSYLQLVTRFNVTELLDRRGDQLFGDGDVAFSWAAAALGQGFGVFRALHITHLISADRLTQRYFLRRAHDGYLSSGVLHYLRSGILPGGDHSRVEVWVRLILHGIMRGPFAMRFRWATLAGIADANRFIEERCLRPLDQGDHQAAGFGLTTGGITR
jgi:glycosyltransferase involved in cell wall biosynthesis